MRIIGGDLRTSQQTIAMLTGEVGEHTLPHDGETVQAFYQALPAPVVGDQSFSFTLVVYQMSRPPCAPTSVRVEKK